MTHFLERVEILDTIGPPFEDLGRTLELQQLNFFFIIVLTFFLPIHEDNRDQGKGTDKARRQCHGLQSRTV